MSSARRVSVGAAVDLGALYSRVAARFERESSWSLLIESCALVCRLGRPDGHRIEVSVSKTGHVTVVARRRDAAHHRIVRINHCIDKRFLQQWINGDPLDVDAALSLLDDLVVNVGMCSGVPDDLALFGDETDIVPDGTVSRCASCWIGVRGRAK